jgi:hypothetical protein
MESSKVGTHQVIRSGSISSRANLLTSSSVKSSGLVLVIPNFSSRLNMIGAKVRTPFLAGQRRLKSCYDRPQSSELASNENQARRLTYLIGLGRFVIIPSINSGS